MTDQEIEWLRGKYKEATTIAHCWGEYTTAGPPAIGQMDLIEQMASHFNFHLDIVDKYV